MLSSAELSNSNSLVVDDKPTKMATCCKDKAVLVTVYVEKSPVRTFSNHQSHHHHHRYLQHTIRKELTQQKHGGAGEGYSRRAQLLHYSQSLRESARSASSTSPPQSKPVSSNDQQPSNKIIAVQRKPTNSKTPACFDNWRILIPSFLGSMTNLRAQKSGKKKNGVSNDKKMKAVIKSVQVQKYWRLIFSKPISMLHKRR